MVWKSLGYNLIISVLQEIQMVICFKTTENLAVTRQGPGLVDNLIQREEALQLSK